MRDDRQRRQRSQVPRFPIAFHGDRDVWKRLRVLTRRSNKAGARVFVAAPYCGSGAAKLLPLRGGSLLVVDMSEGTVAAGATSPLEVLKFIRRGVEVHSNPRLHAKVFVFPRRAVVGSSNLSNRSAKFLNEAAIETGDTRTRRSAKQFVLSMRGPAPIGPEQAKQMAAHYRRQIRRGNAAPIPRREFIRETWWIMWTMEEDWSEATWRVERRGRAKAKALKASRHDLDSVSWGRSMPWHRASLGDHVVEVRTLKGGRLIVEHPERFLRVEQPTRGESEGVVFFERPTGVRRRTIESCRRILGSRSIGSNALKRRRRHARLLTPREVEALSVLWKQHVSTPKGR